MTTTCDKCYNGDLFIIRGCSGSGKSTLARSLYNHNTAHFEADMYHYDNQGNYNWKPENLLASHDWCKNQVRNAMKNGTNRIIVSNTSTTEKEIETYLQMAEEYNYKVTCLVVEHRHGGKNIHGVPDFVLKNQEKRLKDNLKFL